MTGARARSFWWFQGLFWLIAGGALFISGLSQTDWFPALVRNLFLLFAGFLTSFFLAQLIDHLRLLDELRLRLLAFAVGYLIALGCVVSINAISFTLHGISLGDLDWGQWFSGVMNFALVYWFWTELFIQKVYLKGRPDVSVADEHTAGPRKLVVEDRGGKRLLELDDVVAIEAAGEYVAISTSDQTFLDRCTIQSMEDRLNPSGFLRIHRSAIVHPEQVQRIEPLGKGRYRLELTNGKSLTSSRSYEGVLRQRLL